VATISGSLGTTSVWHQELDGPACPPAAAAAAFFSPNATILPPKPKPTPQGRLYQDGQYLEPEFCCVCTLCKQTEPLKDAAEMRPGLKGDHFTSKLACVVGTSQKDSRPTEPLNQQMTRLSLPHDMIKFGSMTFQLMPKMPLECPAVSLNGYFTLRRSHICMDGCRSSS